MLRRLIFLPAPLLLWGCATAGLTAPPEAFLALGPVAAPANTEATEGEAGTAVNLEEKLETWRGRFRENNRKLRALAWSCRVKYRVPGAYTLHILYRAGADENGDVKVWETTRRTEITQGLTRAPDAQAPDDAAFEQAEVMGALARTYTFPQPGAIERLFSPEQCTVAPGGGIAAKGEGLVMPGDSVEIELPPAPREPVGMTFQSADPTAPAHGVVKWRSLPDGTFYPATVQLSLPGDSGIVTTVENFGFRLQPALKSTPPGGQP